MMTQATAQMPKIFSVSGYVPDRSMGLKPEGGHKTVFKQCPTCPEQPDEEYEVQVLFRGQVVQNNRHPHRISSAQAKTIYHNQILRRSYC
jgi:hypothetical protein